MASASAHKSITRLLEPVTDDKSAASRPVSLAFPLVGKHQRSPARELQKELAARLGESCNEQFNSSLSPMAKTGIIAGLACLSWATVIATAVAVQGFWAAL